MDKGISYGIFTGIGLIAYFLLMHLFGLQTEFWLRVFNVFIMGAGIYMLLNRRVRRDTDSVGYFGGLGLGIRLTVVAVVLFAIFLAIYVNFIDRDFIRVLEQSKMWGTDISINEAVVGILIEGIMSGLVITFILMQFFKGYIRSTQ